VSKQIGQAITELWLGFLPWGRYRYSYCFCVENQVRVIIEVCVGWRENCTSETTAVL